VIYFLEMAICQGFYVVVGREVPVAIDRQYDHTQRLGPATRVDKLVVSIFSYRRDKLLSFLKGLLPYAFSRASRGCLPVIVTAAFLAPLSVSYGDAVFVYEGKDFKQDARIIIREGKVVLSDVDETNLSLIYDTRVDMFLLDGMQALLPQLQSLADRPGTSEEQRELINEITSQANKEQSAIGNEIKVSSIDSNRMRIKPVSKQYLKC